jgi:hypothetical protein
MVVPTLLSFDVSLQVMTLDADRGSIPSSVFVSRMHVPEGVHSADSIVFFRLLGTSVCSTA